MKRVVVTGLGCVTPIGNDVETFWQNAVAGKHGFAGITKFDPADLKIKIAAELKDFNPEEYLEKGEVRKLDPNSQYAIAAAAQAMKDSGIHGKVEPSRFGTYIGSGIGGIGTFLSEYDKVQSKGYGRVSPFFYPDDDWQHGIR